MTAQPADAAAPAAPPVLLTAEEVAVLLRVSKMTVYRMVQAGELEGMRVGRAVRVASSSVRTYMGPLWPQEWSTT